jgi:hypothetical protein
MIIKPFRGLLLRKIVISIISIIVFLPALFLIFFILNYKLRPKKYIIIISLLRYLKKLTINNSINNMGKKPLNKIEIPRFKIVYNIRV